MFSEFCPSNIGPMKKLWWTWCIVMCSQLKLVPNTALFDLADLSSDASGSFTVNEMVEYRNIMGTSLLACWLTGKSPAIRHMTLNKWKGSNFKSMKFITNKPYILNQLHPALHPATTTPPSPNLQEWHVHARPKHPHLWLRWPVRHGSIRPTACSTTSSCCDLGPCHDSFVFDVSA